MINFIPAYDRILVRRAAERETSRGGIIIADVAKEKPTEGEVLAIGEGRILDNGSIRPMRFKVGDRLMFGKYAGSEISIDGESLLVLREEEVIGIVNLTTAPKSMRKGVNV